MELIDQLVWVLHGLLQRVPQHPEGIGQAQWHQQPKVVPKMEPPVPNGKEDAAQAIHRGQEHNWLTEVEAEEGQRLGQQASPEGASVAPGEGIPHGLQQMQLEATLAQGVQPDQPVGRGLDHSTMGEGNLGDGGDGGEGK
jgi:hypothetical protein